MQRVVAVYEVERAYGGPEEGGWWFDRGTRAGEFTPIVCDDSGCERAAIAYFEAAIEKRQMNTGSHDPSAPLCRCWYAARSFPGKEAPAAFPESRPTYA